MARSLAVKVPTASLISLVEEKIASIKEAMANYPTAVKQYEIDQTAHKKAIVASVIKALTDNPQLVGESYGDPIRVSLGYNGNVDVSFDKVALGFPESPKKPENPNQQRSFGREWATPLEMLEKTLRVLKLTAQEEVNASTYSSVMDLL